MVESILNAMVGWAFQLVLSIAMGTLETLLTWWIDDSAYSVNFNTQPKGALYAIRAHTNLLTAVMMFAGFLLACFRVAIQRKGEPFRVAFSQFIELVVITLTLATAANLANIAADGYSEWILEDTRPGNGTWSGQWAMGLDYFRSGVPATSAIATTFFIAVFSIFAAISSAIQFVLMLFRSAVLIVLVGILPAVAASRFSEYGNHAFKTCVAWMISWWLYEPVAATIYSGALRLLASPYQADRLAGLALTGGAVFALPATMRAVMSPVMANNPQFTPRQLGHFVFSGSAVNARKGISILTPKGRPSTHSSRPIGGNIPDRGTPPNRTNLPDPNKTPDTRNPPNRTNPPDPNKTPDTRNPPNRTNPPDTRNPPNRTNPPDPNKTPDRRNLPHGSDPSSGGPKGSPSGPSGTDTRGGPPPDGTFGGTASLGGAAGDLRESGPEGASDASDPVVLHLPRYQVPDYQVPDYQPPGYRASLLGDNSKPGYTPPSLRKAIDENPPSGASGSGR